MELIKKIKQFFKRRGLDMGMGNSLVNLTDDPRIELPISEVERIQKDIQYFTGDFPDVEYLNSHGKHRKRKFEYLNVVKLASRRIASIVFNSKCDIAINNDQSTGDWINQVLKDNNFFNLFEEALEKGAALGGFAMRPYLDGNKIKIAWIRADQFIPLHSNTNNISDAVITSRTQQIEQDTTIYYTLLEFHEWDSQTGDYRITNELYRSDTEKEVGKQVSLSTLDAYKDLDEEVILHGLVRPLFVYFKTPGANNISIESPLGTGIVDNAKTIIDTINKVHDEFYWEIALGQRRIAVDASMLGSSIDEDDEVHPPLFDSDQNVYQGFYSDGDNSIGVKDMTSPIRSKEYTDALNHFIEEFETQIGLSTGTFSYGSDGLKTATEVVSNNSMTYQTRSSYLTMVEKAIDELVISILELASNRDLNGENVLYSYDLTTLPDVKVHFDDGVFVDKDKQLEEDLKALAAGVLSKQTFLERNYGMSTADAQKEIDQINNEQPEPPVTGDYEQNIGFGKGDDDE
ncbi:phage portal protein [Pediococcus acidilactici]|uniref:phage portal protein n=1 Tax=Pediococcus acidilactici TaxID=1254 RepID=UPI001330CE5C|nr:phage portal protein [Pediococcus acidilactici]KAF0439755.1 phage portal protein [Pediococcus acidilactici]